MHPFTKWFLFIDGIKQCGSSVFCYSAFMFSEMGHLCFHKETFWTSHAREIRHLSSLPCGSMQSVIYRQFLEFKNSWIILKYHSMWWHYWVTNNHWLSESNFLSFANIVWVFYCRILRTAIQNQVLVLWEAVMGCHSTTVCVPCAEMKPLLLV